MCNLLNIPQKSNCSTRIWNHAFSTSPVTFLGFIRVLKIQEAFAVRLNPFIASEGWGIVVNL